MDLFSHLVSKDKNILIGVSDKLQYSQTNAS